MKDAIPNLLKLAGALAITTVIFLLLSPEEKIDDKVLNASMEFLGNKLLAMVPQEQKSRVQEKFANFREQTYEGKVSDKHLEGLALAVLNADAEGRKLKQEEIDSLLTSIEKVEAARRAERRLLEEDLHALGERLQAFEKFEHRWKKMVPEPDLRKSLAPPPRPLYRISRNFVVEIDSAAMAEMAAAHAERFTEQGPNVMVVPSAEALKELARELPALKIELRKAEWTLQWADSLKKAMKESNQSRRKQALLQIQIADSIKKAMEPYHREQPRILVPPLPPPPMKETKPDKQKTPE
ncbi:MAG: hypothetical protein ONB44_01280 [candidate division KSB1 bacterium]|nr:hypothetical protein [candidate division KSB1 bacterium]MDZ7300752.1 hypothetical protein [candidate division KSB1 bacterium]MDZ7309978.1 hypothetical protein [candidate division KSB1 bacterium]